MVIRTSFNNQDWKKRCKNVDEDERLFKCRDQIVDAGYEAGNDGICKAQCWESSLCTQFCWICLQGNFNKDRAKGEVFFVYTDLNGSLILWAKSSIAKPSGDKLFFKPFSPLPRRLWTKWDSERLVGHTWGNGTFRYITPDQAMKLNEAIKQKESNSFTDTGETNTGETDAEVIDTEETNIEEGEGNRVLKMHFECERSSKLTSEFKKRLLANGSMRCDVCGINFQEMYGDIGSGFIEAHHTKPVSLMISNEKTNIKDLKPVCSNCHRMLHRAQPLLTIDELKAMWLSNNTTKKK